MFFFGISVCLFWCERQTRKAGESEGKTGRKGTWAGLKPALPAELYTVHFHNNPLQKVLAIRDLQI